MSKYYNTILNLLALSVIIYTSVDLFYRVVRARLRQVDTKTFVVQHIPEDKGRQKRPLYDYRLIVDRNIFGSAESPTEEVSAEEIEALELTSLKVALLGTVTGSPQNALAVIEETDKKKQGLYRVGDSIKKAVIKKILRGKVVLRVGDRDEILTMEETSPPPTGRGRLTSSPIERGTTVTVSRSEVKESLKNINRLLSEVRIRPHFRNGKPDGLALSKIKKGSLFSRLGLKNGDIIEGINDKSITSPDDIMSLYNKLKSGSEVAIQINRKGRKKTINYRFR